MHYQLHTADAGEGLISLIVVIAVIVAQIVKALKKAGAASGQGAPQQPVREYADPQEELRKFLEELSGVPQPPQRAPEAQKIVTPPHRQPASRPPPAAASKPKPAPPPQRKTPTPVVLQKDVYASPLGSSPRAAAFAKKLRNYGTARESIVLREILGPPLGLRRS